MIMYMKRMTGSDIIYSIFDEKQQQKYNVLLDIVSNTHKYIITDMDSNILSKIAHATSISPYTKKLVCMGVSMGYVSTYFNYVLPLFASKSILWKVYEDNTNNIIVKGIKNDVIISQEECLVTKDGISSNYFKITIDDDINLLFALTVIVSLNDKEKQHKKSVAIS